MASSQITIVPIKAIKPNLEKEFHKWCKFYNVSTDERGLGKDYDLIREYCVVDALIKLMTKSDAFVVFADDGVRTRFSKAIRSTRKVLPHRFVDYDIKTPTKFDIDQAPGEVIDQLCSAFDNGVSNTKANLFWREKFPILAEKAANDVNFRKKLCETR